MNLSPSTVLLIILVAAVANIFILLAVSARSRAGRARQFVEVDGFLSSSYADPGSRSEPQIGDRASASDDRWPTAREQLTGLGGRWPAFGSPDPRPVDPADPQIEPFEYPAPTSLEQRSLELDDPDEASDRVEDDSNDEIVANEDADADEDMNGAEMHDADSDEVKPADAEVEAAPVEMAEIAMSRTITAPRGRDALTGLLDAMAFEEALSHEDAREQRYGRPATVIVFELDGLAKLVDRLGPEPGDRIETALGDSITRLARKADYVARLERGRYAVLLPETDEVAAINYVERIRRACDLWLESGAIAMRLAIGWASTAGDAGLSGAVRVATERMRVELRRSARQADDVTADLEALADEPIVLEVASGL